VEVFTKPLLPFPFLVEVSIKGGLLEVLADVYFMVGLYHICTPEHLCNDHIDAPP